SSCALSSRLSATNELLTRLLVTKPPADAGAFEDIAIAGMIVPIGGATSQGPIFSNGAVNPSRMRSKTMPVWYDIVQPALSYGRVGGAPGKGMTSGCTWGSNMS